MKYIKIPSDVACPYYSAIRLSLHQKVMGSHLAMVNLFPMHVISHASATQFDVYFLVAPRFIENPPGKREPTLHVATSAKLRCRVQPDANAEISWYKDDHPLDFQRENIVKEGFGIKFNHLKMADKGRYMCIVSNSQGSVNFTYYVTVTGERPKAILYTFFITDSFT